MTRRVLYHQGDAVGLKTKAKFGQLSLADEMLTIDGAAPVSIPIESLRSVELFRMNGLGRMLKVAHEKGTLFVTVIRWSLGDFFAIVNFVGTGRLRDELQTMIAQRQHT